MYAEITDWMKDVIEKLAREAGQHRYNVYPFGFWRAYRHQGWNEFAGANTVVFDFVKLQNEATHIAASFMVHLDDDIVDDVLFDSVKPWLDKMSTEQKLEAFSGRPD